MNRLYSKLSGCAFAVALAVSAPFANATFMPVLTSVTPLGSNFSFNYTLNFSTSGQSALMPGDFLTIYDIPGLVAAVSPGGFTSSVSFVGLTAPLTLPSDDPSLFNVTFNYVGAPISTTTVFGPFSIVSSNGFTALDHFTAQVTNVIIPGTKISDIGSVWVPSLVPTGGPGVDVPEGGETMFLLGLAMMAVAALPRLARKFGFA